MSKTTKNNDVVLVTDEADDRTAIYRNGKLKIENHSLSPAEVLKAAGVKYRTVVLTEAQQEAFEWSFPESVEELFTDEKI